MTRPHRQRPTRWAIGRYLRLLRRFAIAATRKVHRRVPAASGPVGALVFGLTVFGVSGPAVAGEELRRSLVALARPFATIEDLAPLVETAGRARLVLLGEASHGSHEFYHWRDLISRRLIEDKGFSFVAVEGDWATLLPLDRYVRHRPGAPPSAREALRQTRRWPRWVWANAELEAFAEWLHQHNKDRPLEKRVGIHGIDLYAVWESLDALRDLYHNGLPGTASIVQQLSRVLAPFRDDPRGYSRDHPRNHRFVERATAQLLTDIVNRLRRSRPTRHERLFEALQHARVVEAGTRYLRRLPAPAAWSWNIRSGHFDQTIAKLLDRYGPGRRAIVWAHNTHIGDARATPAVFSGERSLGELVRRRYGDEAVFLVGLGTGRGELLAARRWEGQRETMSLPDPRADSLESALLACGADNQWLMLKSAAPPGRWLPHRAVGVVFHPDRENQENYVPTLIERRYDAFLFFPRSRPLTPIPANR